MIRQSSSHSRGCFELVDGDRIVPLGSGFNEAAQEFGYIEAVLTPCAACVRRAFANAAD